MIVVCARMRNNKTDNDNTRVSQRNPLASRQSAQEREYYYAIAAPLHISGAVTQLEPFQVL